MTDTTTTAPRHSVLSRLYTGTGAFEIVGRRKFYYLLTGGIVLVALLSMLIRGFTWGIDFEGGTRIQLPAAEGVTTEQVETVYSDTLGTEPVSVQTVGSGAGASIQIRSEALDLEQVRTLQNALYDEFQPTGPDGVPSRDAISVADVSETWGGQITQKALIALAVFLVLVSIYIAVRYERDMALAALAALFFDMIVTAGVYSLVGFEVTPAPSSACSPSSASRCTTPWWCSTRSRRTRAASCTCIVGPTPSRPTSPSTRPSCGRSTPRSSRCCRCSR